MDSVAGEARTLDGRGAADFASAQHTHSADSIVSGTIPEARIPASIARDAEILPTVLQADGAGSTLDADLFDGQDASFFRDASHLDAGTLADERIPTGIARDTEILPSVLSADGSGSTLDADVLDGQNSSFYRNASNLDAGTIPDARLSSNVALLGGRTGGQTLSGGSSSGQDLTLDSTAHDTKGDVLINPTGGNVGIGNTNPSANLTLSAPSVLGAGDNTAAFRSPDGARNSHIHYGTSGDWYIRSAEPTGKVLLQDGAGNVGVGLTNPSTKLSVLSGDDDAILGRTDLTTGIGVIGFANAESGANFGVRGETDSPDGIGVFGIHDDLDGTAAGVRGETNSVDFNAVAVLGQVNSTASGGGSVGVQGVNLGTGGSGYGVLGSHAGSGQGVRGFSPGGTGVFGFSGNGAGVQGSSNGGTGVRGISGTEAGIVGESTGGAGVVARSSGLFIMEAYSGSNRRLVVDSFGNVIIDGAYLTSGADFAEMLPAATGLEPSDVLVIGTDGKLGLSTQPYQSSVAGIYSTKPGVVGGSKMDQLPSDKIPLAVVGIVPVKVVAENGGIQPGDLLVTSSKPGHAMRAGTDAPNGTVVGKALTSLQSGSGTVQMLVTLQ